MQVFNAAVSSIMISYRLLHLVKTQSDQVITVRDRVAHASKTSLRKFKSWASFRKKYLANGIECVKKLSKKPSNNA